MLFIIIYGFSFFTIYHEKSREETSRYYNVENNLNNSYEVFLPLDNITISKEEVYNKLKTVLDENKANIFYIREEEDKTVKYVYMTDLSYFNNYSLSKGSFIDLEDMDTEKFLSSCNMKDENQIGTIAVFNRDNKFEIRTLRSMCSNQNLSFNGYCIIQVQDGNIKNVLSQLKDEFNFSKDLEIVQKDIISSNYFSNNTIWINFIGYLLIMLLVLYEILRSYKTIGIQRLSGYSIKDIYLLNIKEILKLQIISILMVLTFLSIIFIRDFNIYIIDFFKSIILTFIKQIIIILIVSSFPYIYIIPMSVSNMIKNNRSTRDIFIFNIVIKTILLILINVMGVNLINDYKQLDNYYINKCEEWDRAGNYVIVSESNISMEIQTSEKYLLANKEIYEEINKKGAIYADFSRYSSLYAQNNSSNERYKKENVTVNPNYLNIHNIVDVNGDVIHVSEENTNRVLLVPESYKDQEQEIKDYFKFIYTAYRNENWIIKDLNIDIIWIQENQKIFSYNFDVNPGEENMVENAIISVITENNAPAPEYDRIICAQGNPIKIPKSEKNFLYEILNDKFKNLSDKEYKYTVVAANETVASKINEVKRSIDFSIIGILIVLVSIVIIIVQNIYNYFQQYRKTIFVRAFHGYNFLDKYKEYYILFIGSQVFALVILFIINNSNVKEFSLIWILASILEYIISYVSFKISEKSSISKELKVGV